MTKPATPEPMAGDGKDDVRKFWGAVYKTAYSDVDGGLDRDGLLAALAELRDMFEFRDHLAVNEMPVDDLAGKQVLEIGSGAGGHSALFASLGARMTSVDITPERVAATQGKFDLLGDRAEGCRAMQADAENLPFGDGEFDIVYSNGVLHHSPDTDKAVAEAMRVLKPGGKAVIMLYCRSSFHYWFNMWFCVGLLKGRMFKSENWLGQATEWIGDKPQTAINPVTRCYTAGELERLFGPKVELKLRKTEFYFYLIPKLGRLYRRWQIKRYGTHPGGRLVYGEPWPVWSPLEAWLGRRMGWAWNITATHRPDS